MPVRKYTLELADGRRIPVEAEDTYSEQEVLDDAMLRYPGIKALVAEGKDLKNSLKTGAAAAGRGFLSGGAFTTDLLTLAPRAADWLGRRGQAASRGENFDEPFTWLPQSAKTGEAAQRVLPSPKGGSAMERYSTAGVEGVGGAAALPLGVKTGGQALWALGTGGASGTAAQGAQEAGMGPLGQVGAAGGVGLLSALLARRFNPNAATLARETLDGVDPANLDVGVQRMTAAAAGGVPINLSQAMMAPSNIDDMVNFLAQNPAGKETATQLRAQPNLLNIRAGMAKGALPGKVTSPQDVANRVQEGATGAIKEAEDLANAAYRTAAAGAPPVTPAQIADFRARVQAFKSRYPNVPEAQGLADDLLDATVESQTRTAPAPVGKGLLSSKIASKPQTTRVDLTDPGKLSTAVQSVLQGGGRNALNTATPSKQFNRYTAELRSLWKDSIRDQNSGLATAAADARAVHETVGNPLKKSVVGRVAGVGGSSETKEAARAQLQMVLSRGTPEGGSSEILQLEGALRKQDPSAFVDAVKTYISDKINSVRPTGKTRPGLEMAGNLKKALMANPDQARGLQDMLAGVARSQGLPEAQVVDGFMNFMDLVEMAGRVPPKVSGMPVAEIAEAGGKSLSADLVQLTSRWKLGQRIRAKISANAFAEIDKMLTTPEGVRALRVLAEQGPQSPTAFSAVAAAMGLAGSSD